MTKSNITQYDNTADNNTDIQDVPLGENQMFPAHVNNAFREIMADLADINDGTVTLTSPSFASASLTGNLSFGDNNKALFGAGSDLQIYHDGTYNFINAASGQFIFMQADELRLRSSTGETYFASTLNGATSLYYDASLKLSTTSGGINVPGTVTAEGLTISDDYPQIIFTDTNHNPDWTLIGANGRIGFYDATNSVEVAQVNTSGIQIFGTNTLTAGGASFSGDVSFGDNNKALFGAGSDLQIYHDGSNSFIQDAGTGQIRILGDDVRIMNAAGTEISAQFIQDGQARLKYDNSTKLATTSTGIDVTGGITTTALSQFTDVNIPDNNAIRFGNSQDLQIYHDGSNSFVHDNGSGRLYLKANDGVLIQGNNNETLGRFIQDGAVQLYFNGSQKLATTSTGIDVTGTVTADGLTVDGSSAGRATLGTFTNTTNAAGTEAAIALRNQATGNADVSLVASRIGANFGSDFYIETSDSADGTNRKRFNIAEDGDISFYEDTGTTAKLFWDASLEALQIDTNGTGFAINSSSNAYMVIDRAAANRRAELVFSTASTNVLNSPPLSATADWALGVSDSDELAGDAFYIATASGVGNAKMVITQAGSVGIGTSSPSYPMTIHKTGDGIKFEVSDTVDANYRIQVSGSNIITGPSTSSAYIFQTGNTERMRIDSSGNVGIGIASPLGQLHINTESAEATKVYVDGEFGQEKSIELRHYNASEGSGVGRNLFYLKTPANDRLDIGGFTDGSSEFKVMTLMESGLVGIGTTSPDRLLDIEGNVPAVRLTDTSVSGLHHEILGDGNSLSIEADDGNVGSGSSINFKVDGTERARLDSSGNLMVGGTISNPAFSNTSGAISLRGVVGTIEASRDGGSALELNRKTNDGTIINLRKDGTTVGSIGTVDSDIYIHSSFSGHAGLRFGNGYVGPTNNAGAVTNGVADLGLSTVRWKDLYLGGTAYASSAVIEGSSGLGNLDATLQVRSTETMAAGTGGTISLMGDDGTGTQRTFGMIKGAKGNASSGAFGGGLEFYTRTNGIGDAVRRMLIDQQGRVGIGTSAPDKTLVVSSSSGTEIVINDSDATPNPILRFRESGSTSSTISTSSNNLIFSVPTSEVARLDSSGNLLVGKTTNTLATAGISLRGDVDVIQATRSGGSGLNVNRLASDGPLARFYKDTVEVGSIGSQGGSNLYIEDADAGLRFSSASDEVAPCGNGGANRDNAINLGASNNRFKDLHLSGTANAGILNLKDTNSNGQINATESGAKLYYNVNDAHIWQRQGSEKARLDSSGNLLVGTTSAGTTGSQLRANGQVRGNSLSIPVFANRIGSSGVNIRLQNNSTTAGGIGTAFNTTFIYGTGGGVTDTGLAFANSQIVPCNGSGVGQDDVFDLGTSTSRFDDVFATNGTINTSDGDEKQDIEELTEAEQRVAVAVKGLLRKFRWKSRVEEKGDDARIHFGIIAQDLQAAFEVEGLDAGRYAMFINSTWTDEETGEERSRMGVRYNELLAFIIAAI